MDPKLYRFLELVFIGGLLVAVLYLGGIFTGQPTPTPTRPPAQPTPSPDTPTPRPLIRLIEPKPSPRPSATPSNYTIAPGDTCIAIATRFDVSLQSLIELNALDADCRIFAGDTLRIPQPTPTIAP